MCMSMIGGSYHAVGMRFDNITSFIQSWDSKRLPEQIKCMLLDYTDQDVIFIPSKTSQQYKILGEIQTIYEVSHEKKGINYHLEKGQLVVGTNLKVVL